MDSKFKEEVFEADFCVVGGGISGLCAAVAAARRGLSVVLMHDRPVLGGNASSEIRMWICGSNGKNLHETGIIEDIQLDNCFYNGARNYSVWDTVLYSIAKAEKNLRLLLNCSCNGAEMDGDRIASVTGWQTTTQKWITVRAPLYADCSGDSVLAPLAGAEFRVGREAKSEHGESMGRDKADSRTMGMSCLIQARETSSEQKFIPPPWAKKFESDSDLKPGIGDFNPGSNYWWLELGGMGDSIADTEEIRDELLGTALGIWDHYKNCGEHGAANWALDWVGFLPGKRESRRYVGDVILAEGDLLSGGKFHDAIAYGGWPIDDHDPHGFEGKTPSNIAVELKAPYGIPYRSCYSKNIENLFFAGRNISVTHIALSTTRVMCTCGAIGQAVGIAASVAKKHGVSPRGVYERHIGELREEVLDDDCFILGAKRRMPSLMEEAAISSSAGGDAANLVNGVDRPYGGEENDFLLDLPGYVSIDFPSPRRVESVRIVFDSNLNRLGASKYNTLSNYRIETEPLAMPHSLVRDFDIEIYGADGKLKDVLPIRDNHRRMAKIAIGAECSSVRLVPKTMWGGGAKCRLFAFDAR